MKLGFKETEAIFAARYGLSQPTIAFRGRLQHLQRASFPTGVNTGKGKNATYDWPQLLQLSVALDLIDVGLTPDAAKRLVLAVEEHMLTRAASVGVEFSEAQLHRAIQAERLPFAKSIFIVTSANALSSLRVADVRIDSVNVTSGSELIKRMRGENPWHNASGTFIDLGIRLLTLMKGIEKQTGESLKDIVADFQEWANNVVHP